MQTVISEREKKAAPGVSTSSDVETPGAGFPRGAEPLPGKALNPPWMHCIALYCSVLLCIALYCPGAPRSNESLKRNPPGAPPANAFLGAAGKIRILVGKSGSSRPKVLWRPGLSENFAWQRKSQISPPGCTDGKRGHFWLRRV